MSEETGFKDTINIEREGNEFVNAKVRLSSGKLAISGGSESFCSGTLKYADEIWKPEVSYAVEDGVGNLLISPPAFEHRVEGKSKYDWDIAFADDALFALGLQVGSGKTKLNLQDSMIAGLKCEIGSGPLDVNLLGTLAALERVRLMTGSGPVSGIFNGTYAKLKELKMATGSGSIQVALGGDFPALESLKLATASGQIDVGLNGGFDSIEKMKFDTASGDININLENLKHDVVIGANTVSGNFVIRYPASMGVALKATTLSGKYKADGFTRQHGEYVNDVYGEADVNVRIKFSAVSGNLILQPSEA